MNKALIALALVFSLALVAGLIAGCSNSVPKVHDASIKTNPEIIEPAADNTITGQIQDVDKLNSELNDSGLQDIDSQLNEVNW